MMILVKVKYKKPPSGKWYGYFRRVNFGCIKLVAIIERLNVKYGTT